MTTTAATTSATNTTSPTNSTASAQQALSSNYDTFLKLLTSQLQNQDPLNPVDSSQFTQQLVEYSQVEQQISTNSKLDSLITAVGSNANGGALSYLGHTALFNSNAATVSNGSATWQYALGSAAATDTLTVKDSQGNVVYTTTGELGAGQHDFTWDGTTNSGEQATSGTYYLSVTAADSANAAVDSAVAVKEQITGVDLSGTTPSVTTVTGSRQISTIMTVEN